MEKAAARICREAGAVVREGGKLRDLNIAIAAGDNREIEVLANGLPVRGGAQLAIDITLRSPLTASGEPHPRAAGEDGIAANAARGDKSSKYPELVAGGRCSLVVLALETGGRMSAETVEFLQELAFAKSREAFPAVRRAAGLAWQLRWTRMLSCTAARSWWHSVTAPAEAAGPAADDAPPL